MIYLIHCMSEDTDDYIHIQMYTSGILVYHLGTTVDAGKSSWGNNITVPCLTHKVEFHNELNTTK